MYLHTAFLVVFLGISCSPTYAATAGLFAEQPKSDSKVKPKTEKAKPAVARTGCIDQRDGRYVLVDDRTLRLISDIEADGFPQEGFAKHLGQKVTVKGRESSVGGRQVFQVRSIVTVSESCAQ